VQIACHNASPLLAQQMTSDKNIIAVAIHLPIANQNCYKVGDIAETLEFWR